METEFSRRETTPGARVDLQKLGDLVDILDAQHNNRASASLESSLCGMVIRRMDRK